MIVTVERGAVPDGLALGTPVVSPATVIVRGASSRVAAVHQVVAPVAIDASGLNVDQDVDVEPKDETGAPVPGVELIPQRVHVHIDVARELAYATLPVAPVLTGAPAPGYRVERIDVEPEALTVSGEASTVEQMTSIPTQPVDVTGITEPTDLVVDAVLPADVSLVSPVKVRLAVIVGPDTGSRTWQVGVQTPGARPGRQYSLSAATVLVTLAGSQPDLMALDPSTIVAQVKVARLAPGVHEVDVVVDPIDGLDLVSVAPSKLLVTVSATEPSGGPSPVASDGVRP